MAIPIIPGAIPLPLLSPPGLGLSGSVGAIDPSHPPGQAHLVLKSNSCGHVKSMYQ